MRSCKIAGPLSNARKQQATKYGLSRQQGRIEEFERRLSEPPGLEVPPLVEQHQSLVQIDQGWPDLVFFLCEHLSSSRKNLQALECLPLLTHGYRFKGQTLRRFISHLQSFKFSKTKPGKFGGFCTQVQLEIEFGQIHVAQTIVVSIANLVAPQTSRAEHVNRLAVLTAQEVQICDVVIRLCDQE